MDVAIPRILVFAGSTRKASFNRMLATLAAGICREAGAEVTHLELADYPLPLFSQDLEADEETPVNALALKELFRAQNGFVIACPEYNSSITPLLKNTIDWLSRRRPDEPPLLPFKGKTATLLSASPGALGGLRGLVHVRAILGNLGVIVLPSQVAISQAHKAFDETGAFTESAVETRVRTALAELVDTAAKLASS